MNFADEFHLLYPNETVGVFVRRAKRLGRFVESLLFVLTSSSFLLYHKITISWIIWYIL